MTAQQLRNSILQQAIQGRLVPQDPNDEPASVLLERIRKEKEQLVKEGKLKKKDLVTTPIADDEKPFDIPENWEWAKVGNIFQTYSGGTPDKGHPEYYSSNDVKWAKVGDLGSLYLSETEEYISTTGMENSSAKLYPVQTVLVAMYCNDAIGKSSVTKSVMASNQAICGLLPNSNVLPEYLYYVIQYFRPSLIEKSAGGAQKNINQKIVNDIVFPLPPLAEQRRIVAKIEELMPLVEKYGKAQTELDTLNQDLPRRLRQSVLQQAIQGKLVEQDEKEGNASELLLRLREVRRNKIKSGEIKLSKPEKALKIEISNDFDLPSSWTWCVLNDVCRAFGRIGFRGYTKEDIVSSKEEGAIAISPSNMENLRLNFNKCTYITEAKYQESPEIMVENGDVLLTKTASVGKLALVENLPWKATINPQIAVLKEISIDNKYLTYVLASPYIQDIIHGFTIGTSIPTYSQEKMLGINIPLPPLAEQRRIVAKIEELFAEIDKLK